jgi:putative membrane protein
MTKFLVRWGISAAMLLVVAALVDGISLTWLGALEAAVVLGLINAIIRPILVLFTLPLSIMTFGLFIFVLNALLFWLAAAIVPGFSVHGFVAAFMGALVFGLLNVLVHMVFRIGDRNTSRAKTAAT